MNALKISNQVPFAPSICWRLELYEANLLALTQNSHQFDFNYLAWQTVRKKRNPYFVNGTGFEGYLIGMCQTPDQALDYLLELGRVILNNVVLLYRFDYDFRSRLMKTLVGEQADLQAMYEWNALFGAHLARLRCTARRNYQAAAFRTETYRLVEPLPEIAYRKDADTIQQEYFIAPNSTDAGSKLTVASSGLKSSDQDAWLVAESLGRFGHPLVRTYLRKEFQANGLRAA